MSIILPASLLTFIYDNKSLTSVYMNSNDGVHKLVQCTATGLLHSCLQETGNKYGILTMCLFVFLGKTGEM